MIETKARREFAKALLTEIEAFARDITSAVEQPIEADEHTRWIKGLSDLSRVITRHLPEGEQQLPEDEPLQTPKMATLEELGQKLKIRGA